MLSGALPAWDLGTSGSVLAVVRAVWLAALLSAGGALLFRALEPAMPPGIANRLMRLILASFLAALLGWLAWVAVQSAALTGTTIPIRALRAMPSVLQGSEFGRLALIQLALLGGAALALRVGRWPPAILSLAAVAVQAGHMHAWAMQGGTVRGGLLVAATLLHLLAAAAWLGGLLPLRIMIKHSAPALAAAASRRFSRRVTPCVAILAVSALVQGWQLLGGLPGIFGTTYGWIAAIKLLLFAALLGYAARHRFRLTPALARPEPAATHGALVRSIGRETAFGALVVLAAALLSGLQPGMHLQPVWPFAWQPSLVTVREDAGFAAEAIAASLGVVAALGLSMLAAMRRRVRWPALAVAAALAWIAVPHLDLLLVPATPTSFYRSPTGFAATGIADGEALYPQHCAGCHGGDGRGGGPAADLTAAHLWAHPDGELFWWLSHGIGAPSGTGAPAMPGFAASLSEDDRWHLIDFVRARNAGLGHVASGRWPVPLAAPDIAADCADGRSVTLAEMRGRPVRLAFQAAAADSPSPSRSPDATTVFVPLPEATEAAGGDCIASDPSVSVAYQVVTGLAPEALAGSDVLIDANGWLREVLRSGPPAVLAAALRRITTDPLPAAGGASPLHPHR